jgi:zinc transport system permease protein
MLAIDILAYDFMQRAFAAGLIIGIICASLGVFLVLKRLSLIGDGLAHAAFGGVALGLFLRVNPILSALVAAVLSALWTYRLQSKTRLYGETAIGIMIAAGLGLGVVLISFARGFTTDLFSILFGSILTVTPFDLWLILGLGVLVLCCIFLFYKELVFLCFDEEGARAAGIPVARLNILLNVLTAITIVISIRLVGILLVSALIVVPAAAGLRMGKSFAQAIWYSIVVSLLAVIVGLVSSYYFGLAAGGAIVLASVLLFIILSFTKNTVQ